MREVKSHLYLCHSLAASVKKLVQAGRLHFLLCLEGRRELRMRMCENKNILENQN